jgi:hypothetical protein
LLEDLSRRCIPNQLSKPVPLCGPCKTCWRDVLIEEYAKDLLFHECYTSSTQFKAMIAVNRNKMNLTAPQLTREMRDNIAAQLRTGEKFLVWNAGSGLSQALSNRQAQVLLDVCYRSYMAKRFDRWVANPEPWLCRSVTTSFSTARNCLASSKVVSGVAKR